MTESAGLTIPATVSAYDVPPDAETFDVVVVGFGIAGGCAALEAARAGARVLLLEKAAVHGGTSSMSGGHFYLGAGTAVQQATGHDDSVDAMTRYLMASTKDPDEEKIRLYCQGSVEHFDWLEALGFQFERSFFPGKAVIQPNSKVLLSRSDTGGRFEVAIGSAVLDLKGQRTELPAGAKIEVGMDLAVIEHSGPGAPAASSAEPAAPPPIESGIKAEISGDGARVKAPGSATFQKLEPGPTAFGPPAGTTHPGGGVPGFIAFSPFVKSSYVFPSSSLMSVA